MQLKVNCSGDNWQPEQMDLGLLRIILIFGVLVFLRVSVALWSRGTFRSAFICVNDISRISSGLSSDEQLCNCDNGTELSMQTAKKDLPKMSRNGTTITSSYI